LCGQNLKKEISSISTALDEHNNAYFETPRRVDVYLVSGTNFFMFFTIDFSTQVI